MTYDPNQPTQRDVIRSIVSDTDATDELMTDAEYDAVIGRTGMTFNAAVSEIAYSLSVKLDRKITSFAAQGKVQLGWGTRASSLREIAKRYAALADDEANSSNDGPEVGKVVTVTMPYLTADPYDLEVW
ncbi:MAG: hypothetical protein WBA46_04600 [Thermomicrobiales bacterium]